MPTADNFELKDVEPAAARRGHDPRAQPLAVGRPLHARPDERREKLCPAVPARRADGRRRDRRGGREQGATASRRAISCSTWPAGATRRWCPARAATKLPDLGAEPQQFLGVLGIDRRDRLFRPARRGVGQGRRHRLRVGRRGRRGIGRGPDRQGQRHDGHRLGRRRGEVRLRPLARRRLRSSIISAGPILKALAAAAPDGHRRLFRQCRRRPSRRRARARPQPCPLRDLRDDRGLQQRRADQPSLHACGSSPRASGSGLPGVRLSAADGRILSRDGRVAAERRGQHRARRSSMASSRCPTRSSACSPARTSGKMLVQL